MQRLIHKESLSKYLIIQNCSVIIFNIILNQLKKLNFRRKKSNFVPKF